MRARGAGRGWALWPIAVLLLAALPSLGTLDAPWIAEDAAILARVRAGGWLADWNRSQYGLELVRFWRPLVSAAWGLQEAWTGIAPLPLRLANLALHAMTALFAGALARRLGGSERAALLAGAVAALFPAQGGTVTWLAGRTDLLAGVFLVAGAWAALGRFPLASAPLAFAACASKEFGFLLPLWVFLLAAARDAKPLAALTRAGPAALGAALAFAWRWVALGTALGGYPGGVDGLTARGVVLAARALFERGWPGALGLVLGLATLPPGRSERRACAAALLCAASACLPLWPLIADGALEPENARLLHVPALGLALVLGLSIGQAGGRLGALALLFLALRFELARQDTHRWARSARAGEEFVAAARRSLAGAASGAAPVLRVDFPSSLGGAYCLGFGLADRFRLPFPAAARPVWPWRVLFGVSDARRREPLVAPRADGSIWPLDDAPRVPPCTVLLRGAADVRTVALDERAFLAQVDRSDVLEIEAPHPGAALEVLVFTESGYEPVPAGSLDAAGRARLSLMRLLLAGNGVANVAQVLLQTADLGAQRAYFELRVLDAGGAPVAASPWVELTWERELFELALSAR